MSDRLAYLDHAATTAVRPEALAAMLPLLTERFGNPSGSHGPARAARRAVDDAREEMAALLGAAPGEIVFTSGGTESDNLALSVAGGAAPHLAAGAPGAICAIAVEHPAVLEPTRAAGGRIVPVDADGIVDLEALADLLDEHVRVVSVMAVNNETGAVQPVEAVAELVRATVPGALVHCDAVQAVAWLDPRPIVASCDLVTVSGHKIGAPKGVGALVVGERAASWLRPQLLGGPQERERRAGTPNVAGIVAMATALRATDVEREAATARVGHLAERLVAGLSAALDGVEEAVGAPLRVPAIVNLGFAGVEAEELLILLDDAGVAASAGSSCASGALEPSHVLMAMGRSEAEARRHVRFSLGYPTTADEIEHALAVVPKAVERLRD